MTNHFAKISTAFCLKFEIWVKTQFIINKLVIKMHIFGFIRFFFFSDLSMIFIKLIIENCTHRNAPQTKLFSRGCLKPPCISQCDVMTMLLGCIIIMYSVALECMCAFVFGPLPESRANQITETVTSFCQHDPTNTRFD